MSVALWQPSTDYALGAIVQPTAVPENESTPITDGGFESGGGDWTYSGAAVVVGDSAGAFEGDNYVKMSPNQTGGIAKVESSFLDVEPARGFIAQCYFDPRTNPAAKGQLQAYFVDASDNFVATLKSTFAFGDGTAGYRKIVLLVQVPASAAKVKFIGQAEHDTGESAFDSFSWNYTTTATGAPLGLLFEATTGGKSGLEEPAWPDTVSATVTDGTVEWTAVQADTVTWEARALLKSGDTEPSWPTVPGQIIQDGTMQWRCESQAITDRNCPQTKEVAIGASKIFAGDNDVVRFSATLDPRDWSTPEDAGFLPTGLQQEGQVGVTAMGNYRGNLVVWNQSSVQVWQIDPDPVAMALLDSMNGIGSAHHKAAEPVSNDLFFLAALGVRTVGIAVGAENLAAGDAGLPIDVLVQPEVNQTIDPIATYYPSFGQYWLTFPTKSNGRPGVFPETPTAPDPGEYQFSTMQYPYVLTEGIESSNSLKSGWVFGLDVPELDATHSLQSGSLLDVVGYKDYTEVPELDGTHSLESGTLETVVGYKDYTEVPELDGTHSLQSGDLVVSVQYIDYDVDEAIESSHSLQSGTLAA